MIRRLIALGSSLSLWGLTVLTFTEEKKMSSKEAAGQLMTTEPGLQHIDLVVGTWRQAHLGDTATVHYTG